MSEIEKMSQIIMDGVVEKNMHNKFMERLDKLQDVKL